MQFTNSGREIGRNLRTILAATSLLLAGCSVAYAQAPAEHLPLAVLLDGETAASPVDNSAFVPGTGAGPAESLHAHITIERTRMSLDRELSQPVCDGRDVKQGGSCRGGADKRVFPEVSLELYSFAGDTRLGAAEIGEIIGNPGNEPGNASYWHVIPQYGRVWREPGDGQWSRAALPLMLVHDFENVAHQGLLTFLFKDGEMSSVRLQFVQQSTPWNTPEHFVAWATARATMTRADSAALDGLRQRATEELEKRLEVRPWSELEKQYPEGALDGFGGPLGPDWVVIKGIVKDGVIYRQESVTPYGEYPYPDEMRFGIRSMTKSITVPLTLAGLAQAYGPYVLDLKIGDYVAGLHERYDHVRFLDAANMATGMGGSGDKTTVPNNGGSGYVDDSYDDWYNGARSAEDKIRAITSDTGPYPWGPGVVYRYRDRDFHVLGTAANGFLRAMRGEDANIWDFVEEEVLRPIGIFHAPIVRTIEANGQKGIPWFHAGYYPTMDDVAKISLLYVGGGKQNGEQVLHAGVVAQFFTSEGTLVQDYDHSLEAAFGVPVSEDVKRGRYLYKMGFHYAPYETKDGEWRHVPAMQGFSATTGIFHPNGLISLRFAKAWPLPESAERALEDDRTMEIVNALED